MSEREENSNPATPPTNLSLPPQPSGSSGHKNRSQIWEYFISVEGIEKYARCKSCNGQIKYAAGGTSAMRQHWKRCFDLDNEQSKRQRIEGGSSGSISSLSVTKFDQAVSQSILTEMFMTEELAFQFVEGHSGKVLGRAIEDCLDAWKLHQVFTVTVDNATSIDGAILYLKRRLNAWNSLVLKGDYLHMRYSAYILNLIVKDGFKKIDDSITRICNAVKYVKSSPMRSESFKAYIEWESSNYKGLVSLDVETQWNSTYLMLEAALKLRVAFDLLELQDDKYINKPSKLKIFYDTALHIS
ncbi:zinc finger BED domain-containing protein RICESLEEPER 2-like [Arachis duranensis]|uniref:Zinc finger BED domain-containing protein RICESLEEPER 2-like n=1 Tax=Arachis duranensis TaxID=130453 RepID=A0A6P4CDJ2_ARADU|nr:zinc finger BED domain-containing protein RICESLEEPER 2-like [Arachis duranensis]